MQPLKEGFFNEYNFRCCCIWSSKCSPITQYIVLYPNLLAVGSVTHDMCACIVRQDYTGAHFFAFYVLLLLQAHPNLLPSICSLQEFGLNALHEFSKASLLLDLIYCSDSVLKTSKISFNPFMFSLECLNTCKIISIVISWKDRVLLSNPCHGFICNPVESLNLIGSKQLLLPLLKFNFRGGGVNTIDIFKWF